MATARKLKSGNWRILVYTGKDASSGKRIYKSFTGSTKKEAERLAADWQERERQPLTLGSYAEQYISIKRNVLSPSTVRGYESIIRNGIAGLAPVPLDALDSRTVQQAINDFSSGHAPKTTRNVYGLVTVICEMFRPDLPLRVTLPQREKKEIFIPSPELIGQIYEKVKGTMIEYAFLLASQCGLRASEIAGLTLDRIKPDRLQIREAVVKGPDNAMTRKTTKTVSGTRDVPISPSLSRRLVELYALPRYSEKHLSSAWTDVLRRIGIPHFSFHKLRHYFASNAAYHNVPKPYTVRMMGHSSSRMVDTIYTHVFEVGEREFASRLFAQTDDLLAGK